MLPQLTYCSFWLQGERGTWEKLAAIRANCGIELTIDACLAKLTNEVKNQRVLQTRTSRSSLRPGQGQPFLRARTPSWINLQAYGTSSIRLKPSAFASSSGFISIRVLTTMRNSRNVSGNAEAWERLGDTRLLLTLHGHGRMTSTNSMAAFTLITEERCLPSDSIERLSSFGYTAGLKYFGLAGMPNVPSDEQMLERQDSAKELGSPRGALLSSNPRPILADLKGGFPLESHKAQRRVFLLPEDRIIIYTWWVFIWLLTMISLPSFRELISDIHASLFRWQHFPKEHIREWTQRQLACPRHQLPKLCA